MDLAIVTDELSLDPVTAVELAAQWGIHKLELRRIGSHRVPNVDKNELSRLDNALLRFQSRVVSLSPGLFRLDWTKLDEAREMLNRRLPEILLLAERYHVNRVVEFTPFCDTEDDFLYDAWIDLIRRLANSLLDVGVRLLIENHAGTLASTGERTAVFLEDLGHPNVGLNWDPGNAWWAGEVPYPDGYAHVSPWVEHVHVKDGSTREGRRQWEIINRGEIDWRGQLSALASDRFRGDLVVETHCMPKIEAGSLSVTILRELLSQK